MNQQMCAGARFCQNVPAEREQLSNVFGLRRYCVGEVFKSRR
jgi:hypothetical protein